MCDGGSTPPLSILYGDESMGKKAKSTDIKKQWEEQKKKGEMLPIMRPQEHMFKDGDSIIIQPQAQDFKQMTVGKDFDPYLLPIKRFVMIEENDKPDEPDFDVEEDIFQEEYLIVGDKDGLNGSGKQIARFLEKDTPILIMKRVPMMYGKEETHTYNFKRLLEEEKAEE
jgi:hypothetical protein